jgi:hypothetical protein
MYYKSVKHKSKPQFAGIIEAAGCGFDNFILAKTSVA